MRKTPGELSGSDLRNPLMLLQFVRLKACNCTLNMPFRPRNEARKSLEIL